MVPLFDGWSLHIAALVVVFSILLMQLMHKKSKSVCMRFITACLFLAYHHLANHLRLFKIPGILVSPVDYPLRLHSFSARSTLFNLLMQLS